MIYTQSNQWLWLMLLMDINSNSDEWTNGLTAKPNVTRLHLVSVCEWMMNDWVSECVNVCVCVSVWENTAWMINFMDMNG